MKVKITLKKFLLLLAIVYGFNSHAQLVGKTYTIVPFNDVNNNAVLDAGEDTIKNIAVLCTNPYINNNEYPCQTTCSGVLTNIMTVDVCNSFYSINGFSIQ